MEQKKLKKTNVDAYFLGYFIRMITQIKLSFLYSNLQNY